MNPDQLSKIRSLSQRTQVRNIPNHQGVEGPYWRGHYRENGQRVTVHIGKQLPAELFWLLKGRYKKPGSNFFSWPKPDEKP